MHSFPNMRLKLWEIFMTFIKSSWDPAFSENIPWKSIDMDRYQLCWKSSSLSVHFDGNWFVESFAQVEGLGLKSSWGMAVDPPERDERERRSREERGTAAGPGRSECFLPRNGLPCRLISPGGSSWCRSGWASSSTGTASFVPARLVSSVRKDICAWQIFGYCLTDNLSIPPE